MMMGSSPKMRHPLGEFEIFDLNQDGVIDRGEFKKVMLQHGHSHGGSTTNNIEQTTTTTTTNNNNNNNNTPNTTSDRNGQSNSGILAKADDALSILNSALDMGYMTQHDQSILPGTRSSIVSPPPNEAHTTGL